MKKLAVLLVVLASFGSAHAGQVDDIGSPSPIHTISSPANIVKALSLVSEDIAAKRAVHSSGPSDVAIPSAAGFKVEKIEIYEGMSNSQSFVVVYTPAGLPKTSIKVEQNAKAYFSKSEVSRLR